MPKSQSATPVAANAGVSPAELNARAAATAAPPDDVEQFHNLALHDDCRFNALVPMYQALRAQVGPDLDAQFAQLRTDLLAAIDEQGDWRWALANTENYQEHVELCANVIEQALSYLQSDARPQHWAGGDPKQLRRLMRIVITQLITFLEAVRLPGLRHLIEKTPPTH
jgi:hypothetical protein